ncbi:hypothetical protein [Psychrobacter phenylpyruvicus]|uniref:hypothetical protein n=1 Tax=Psychrobacter phenylpyruvicus TaxID=29432 RepID=UPI00048D59CE|nr:hypothetical protein [Psychrobacter phenylpyruvicus]
MTEGDYTVKARIVDTAGNEGATATQVVKIDTTVPATTPTVDADLATPAFDVLYTTSTSPVITGTVSEALISGETLEVTIGGATYIVTPEADNSWSLDTSTASPKAASPAFIPLASGDNSVVAKVLDTAGNASTDVTSDEVVVLAKVKELTLSDDLTDFDANGDELSNTTTPTGSATVINGVQSTDYGAAYLYEGNVAQALDIGTPVAPLEGLTNDNTPTVIIKLDKEIAINYQELQVIRSYKDEEGNWIDEGVIASTSGSGISLTGSGPDFSFDDTLSDGEPDKEYRYEAKVDNIPAIADSNLETSESVEFELDTVATVPIITGFDTTNNTISGISTENGTIFVNYNNEKSKVIVTEGAEWTLQLTTSQMNAFLDVNDPDNYDVNSNSSAEPTAAELTAMQAETEVFDEFLPIDFVDKAGNVTPVANEIYYFDSSDGPNGVLNPEDNPETATTSFSPGQPDPIPTTTINGDVYQIYTTTFSDASQTVYVDGNIDNYNGADDIFNLDLAGGNDTLKLNGNIENGVNIFMGAGDDTVIAEKLDGQSANNPTVIDMGDGNNTVTKTAEGNFNYIQVIAGDGDDVFEMKLPNSDLKNSSLLLGGGNNYINSGDDFDNVTVITGDGDDTIFVESPVNENNCDISGVYDLGDGNNKIVLTSGGINNWYTESGTTITMGAGDDIVDIAKDFDNSNQGNKVTSMSTGAGIDKITIGEDINGDTVSIYLNDGDDELTVRNIEGGSLVDTGLGIDTVVITGSIQGVGTAVDLGDGGDFITISDNILASTNTNLGAGNDTFTLTGYIDGNVDAGAGNDILNFNGNIRAGATVDGGDGTDTINITNSNSNSNISLSNILNVEIINLNNSDRNLNNVNIDNLTNDLYMKGGADDTVNIGRQSGLTEPYRFEDTAGGVWTKGGTEVDANDGSITYNVWSNASSTHSVYIQDTITDVI